MPINTSAGGSVAFKVAVSGSGSFPWDKVEDGEDIVLEYSTDGVVLLEWGGPYSNTTWQSQLDSEDTFTRKLTLPASNKSVLFDGRGLVVRNISIPKAQVTFVCFIRIDFPACAGATWK